MQAFYHVVACHRFVSKMKAEDFDVSFKSFAFASLSQCMLVGMYTYVLYMF